MNIAELFINLGVKGADSAGKALKGVKDGLGEVKGMSLEAKAAIIGVIYGLERMMSQSAQMGTSLTNFNALTGMSAQQLQQWQYAARQAGVAGDEMAGSMKAVQSTMANMLLGKGAPEGMAMLANKVGFDPARARDTAYVLQQLQKFAQSVPQDVGNTMLKSFGLSEGVIAAMRRNAFRPDVMAKAPTYSDKEVGALDKTNVAWSNLGNKVQMAFGHFTAKHGTQLVSDLDKIISAVIRLTEALTILSEKLGVFEKLGAILTGISAVVEGGSKFTDDLKKGKVGEHLKKANEKMLAPDEDLRKRLEERFGNMKAVREEALKPEAGLEARLQNHFAPPVKPPLQNKTVNNTVNQTLQFQHDGKDHKKTSDSTQKAVHGAYRQIQAQAQGS